MHENDASRLNCMCTQSEKKSALYCLASMEFSIAHTPSNLSADLKDLSIPKRDNAERLLRASRVDTTLVDKFSPFSRVPPAVSKLSKVTRRKRPTFQSLPSLPLVPSSRGHVNLAFHSHFKVLQVQFWLELSPRDSRGEEKVVGGEVLA